MLDPLLYELSEKDGIKITKQDRTFIISINIYAILADSPGRALLLFMKQHGGYLSCPYCFIPGKYDTVIMFTS